MRRKRAEREAKAAQVAQEREKIERYWFENPFGFQCHVVLREPRERQALVGMDYQFGGPMGAFGALPVPFHGEFTDNGTFQVRDDGFAFLGQNCSRFIPYGTILCTTWFQDGSIQFHRPDGMMTFCGPIRAAVIGALLQSGTVDPADIPSMQKAIG
jgi:hypothetical protein